MAGGGNLHFHLVWKLARWRGHIDWFGAAKHSACAGAGTFCGESSNSAPERAGRSELSGLRIASTSFNSFGKLRARSTPVSFFTYRRICWLTITKLRQKVIKT